jgi:UDP-galactopyranose mutase
MYTFEKLLNIQNIGAAKHYIQNLKQYEGDNAEVQCLNTIGPRLYEAFFEHQLQKHWGKHPSQLDASIVRRIPIRYTYDTRYYDTYYEGLLDYNLLVEKMLEGVEVQLGADYFMTNVPHKNLIFTGEIDQFYNYKYGALEYRTLDISYRMWNKEYVFGAPLIRYDKESQWYRSIEWKLVHATDRKDSLVSYEYARHKEEGDVPMYPVLTEENKARYQRYASIPTDILFLGRLGTFRYLNMDQAIGSVISKLQ